MQANVTSQPITELFHIQSIYVSIEPTYSTKWRKKDSPKRVKERRFQLYRTIRLYCQWNLKEND